MTRLLIVKTAAVLCFLLASIGMTAVVTLASKPPWPLSSSEEHAALMDNSTQTPTLHMHMSPLVALYLAVSNDLMYL